MQRCCFNKKQRVLGVMLLGASMREMNKRNCKLGENGVLNVKGLGLTDQCKLHPNIPEESTELCNQ